MSLLTNPKLLSFVATRDRKIAPSLPHSPTPLAELLAKLVKDGRVTVGGRATCGTYVDLSWVVYRYWNEVVAKARKLGHEIAESNVPQKNSWATKAGGFWEEREYSLAARK